MRYVSFELVLGLALPLPLCFKKHFYYRKSAISRQRREGLSLRLFPNSSLGQGLFHNKQCTFYRPVVYRGEWNDSYVGIMFEPRGQKHLGSAPSCSEHEYLLGRSRTAPKFWSPSVGGHLVGLSRVSLMIDIPPSLRGCLP